MTRIVFTLFSFLAITAGHSQSADFTVSDTQISVKDKTYSGFECQFNLPEKEVRYYFWKYGSTFGRLRNERAYYKLKIPAGVNPDVTADLFLFATSQKLPGGQSIFRLAIDSSNLPKSKIDSYQNQTRRLLLDFQKYIFLDKIGKDIAILTDKAKDLGVAYEKKRKAGLPGAIELEQIESVESEISSKIELQKKILFTQ